MTDIRLEQMPFEFNGKTYMLRCNFNVLADIVNDFGEMPDLNDMTILPRLLSPMLNDYADEMGWPERFTGKQVGRILHPSIFTSDEGRKQIVDIFRLIMRSVYAEAEDADKVEEDPKN